jgi:hypothetical protein
MQTRKSSDARFFETEQVNEKTALTQITPEFSGESSPRDANHTVQSGFLASIDQRMTCE